VPTGDERHEDLVDDRVLPHHPLADLGAQSLHRRR
jgi:hypothetical protein